MIHITNKENCCGCYACVSICPQNCIIMKEDTEGFRYPLINVQQCTDCGLCEKVCPVINRFPKPVNIPKVFAVKNNNEQIRLESSSGGVFSILAERTIHNSGVVFGARVDTNFSVIHDFTETYEGVEAFRGSKYLQSLIGDNYNKAEHFLKQGREVLFTGTPCQIAGLKHFLQEEYNNLLTVDIVCHGVPSPKVFRRYLEELNTQQDGRLEKIQFRNKTEGWKKFSFATRRKAGKNTVLFRQNLDKNIYMRGFLQNLYLRPSCHVCPSKNFTSGSDLTIGDFWGIQQIHPDFDDDKGCSLILCNNSKGQHIFKEIKNELKFIETSIDDALRGNYSIVNSVLPHSSRDKFFNQIDDKPIIHLINHYTKPTIKIKFMRGISTFLHATKVIAAIKYLLFGCNRSSKR